MDRTAGIMFSFVVILLGWAFAPFDKQPTAAFWVSVAISVVGLCMLVYFDVFCSRWWKGED